MAAELEVAPLAARLRAQQQRRVGLAEGAELPAHFADAAKAMDASGEAAVNAAHAAAIAPFVQADGRVRIGATCRLLFATPAGKRT